MDQADRQPALAQERAHRAISHMLVGTQAAQLQPLSACQDLESYRSHVRLTVYEDYRSLVSQAMLRPGSNDYFERGPTRYFGHSSSGCKYVPYTRAHLASFRGFQMDAAAQIGFGLGRSEIFSGRSFMIQGNLGVERAPSGVVRGYSSAVMVELTPWLLRRWLRPRVSDLRIADIEKRVERIGVSLLKERPRILAGIPEYVAAVLRLLLEGPQADAIREVLSHVTVYGWSGSPLGSYRSFFEPLFAPGCDFLDAVSATEGALGIRCPETGSYRFALNRSLLLFTPVGREKERFFAWELETGQDYEVILGSFAGIMGYRLGDRIRRARGSKLRFDLLPRALAGLGFGEASSDYYVFMDPSTSALEVSLESENAPTALELDALTTRLGASSARVRLLPRGRIARAGLRASASGVTKLPRLNRDARVHSILAGHL